MERFQHRRRRTFSLHSYIHIVQIILVIMVNWCWTKESFLLRSFKWLFIKSKSHTWYWYCKKVDLAYFGEKWKSDVRNCIESWVFIQESYYKVHTGKELPLQQGENNSGIYIIMYFLYKLFENDFDFFPGDVIQIRRWVAAALMRNAASSKYSTWLNSCRKYCQVEQVQVTVIIN